MRHASLHVFFAGTKDKKELVLVYTLQLVTTFTLFECRFVDWGMSSYKRKMLTLQRDSYRWMTFIIMEEELDWNKKP